MRHDSREDLVVFGKLIIRSPRRVALLQPFQFPIMLMLTVVATVMIFWPEVLEHAATSFETRGIIHHIWHYGLLFGSVTALVGMVSSSVHRLKIEVIGVLVVIGMLLMNFIALATGDDTPDGEGPMNGLGFAIRLGVLLGLATRAFIILREPTVTIPINEDE